ncbi:MAG: ATP-grasp domain-containing protein [Clostridia bacterium]|nr:ATP-grasp domain-containing protein [Clostridia bacterium]
MKKVAVFFGGKSCESEISILTAVFVMNVLDAERYKILPVYVHTNGKTYTSPRMTELCVFKERDWKDFQEIFFYDGGMYALNKKKTRVKRMGKVDVILNCCHGGLGEGGGVSALAQWHGIPCASPDLTASGVFMDKGTTKLFLRALNIPTLDYIRVNEADYQKRGAFLLKSVETRLKYPVIVKPAHLGSSIGITVAKDEEELKRALEMAFTLDDRVIVEKYLKNKQDVNCAAYVKDGEIIVSEPERAFGDGFYSFEEKYIKRQQDGGGADKKGVGRYALRGDLREKVRAYTKTIYKRMNLRGVVRIDYLISDNKVYVCEVNTVPGSLAYYLFCERVKDAREFFTDLLEEAFRVSAEKKLVTTGILNNVSWHTK